MLPFKILRFVFRYTLILLLAAAVLYFYLEL
jgi:hypothetical protein